MDQFWHDGVGVVCPAFNFHFLRSVSVDLQTLRYVCNASEWSSTFFSLVSSVKSRFLSHRSQRSALFKLKWSVLFPPPKSWLGNWLSTWYPSYIYRIELDLLNILFELLDYWKSVKYCPSKDECGFDDLPMNLLGLGISAHFWLWACFFIWQILI